MNACRGDKFRVEFSRLGDLRSIIPETVHVMALTATSTSETFQIITKRLSLKSPVIVGLSPNQLHVFYEVKKLPKINKFGRELATALSEQRISYPKTIVFCRSYTDCGELYRTVEMIMGFNFTEPYGYSSNFHQFCMLDMYTRAATESMKKVLDSFI